MRLQSSLEDQESLRLRRADGGAVHLENHESACQQVVLDVGVERVTPDSKGISTEERELKEEPCIWKVQLKCCVQSGTDTPELRQTWISDQLESFSDQQPTLIAGLWIHLLHAHTT
ncbi:unnamed protein product [Arctogadus glacialis]